MVGELSIKLLPSECRSTPFISKLWGQRLDCAKPWFGGTEGVQPFQKNLEILKNGDEKKGFKDDLG